MLIVLIGHSMAAGQDTTPEPSAEDLYEKARGAAFQENNFPRARRYAREALEQNPGYHEIRLFIARIHGWEGNYTEARSEIDYILEREPGYREAWLTLAQIETWSGSATAALQVLDRGLIHHPEDEELLYQKATVLSGMEKFQQAEAVYEQILTQNPHHLQARNGLKTAKLRQMKYGVQLSVRYDHFDDRTDPWKFGEFSLSRQTPYGSIAGRVQFARRFGTDGVQFNVDAYPTLADGLYAYASAGYSASDIYPEYRLGFSLYKSLPASFELSAGIRYLDFVTVRTEIYTASLTKYLGSYLFTLGAYHVPSPNGHSQSFSMVIRRYFGAANSYLSLTGGFGSASTDIQFLQDALAHDFRSLELDGRYPLSRRISVGGKAGVDDARYTDFTRNRYTFRVYMRYQF